MPSWSRPLNLAAVILAALLLAGCDALLDWRLEKECRDRLDLDIVDQALWSKFQGEMIRNDAAARGVSFYDGWDFEGRDAVRSLGTIKRQRIRLFRIAEGQRNLVAKFNNYYVTQRRMSHTAFLDCFGQFPDAMLSDS